MKKYVAAVGSLLFLATVLTVPARAAAADTGGINLTTSPIVTSISAKPGGSAATTLHVQNNDANPVTVNVVLETFRALGTNGAAQMMPFAKNDPSGGWVHFSQNSFVAQPGIWSSVTMTVNLPKNAGLGYYYAVIFKPQVAGSVSDLGSTIKGGDAILVLVNALTGNEHPQVSVTNFSADRKLYEYLPANFSISVKNTGNIFLAPTGDVYISKSSDFTHSIDTIPVNYADGNVLAGTSRTFTAEWADGFPVFKPKTVDGNEITDSKGRVEQALNWNLASAGKLRFGKYYAKLVLAYNNGSRDVPIVAVVSFWVIPWKILSAGLVVLILLLIGLYAIGKKLAARTMRLSRKVKPRKRTGDGNGSGSTDV
ncbi:MAG TPA: hypothetical protein VGM08_03775 [Candidatus Saccharimonadales bacterium]|jgi:hypothetical protein